MGNSLTQGSITKNLIAMSLPTTIGFFFRAFYDLVDLMWIGRISAEAVAAVTIFTTVHWMVLVLNEIIGISSLSLVSQYYGAGDIGRTQRTIEQTIAFKTLLGIIASIILLIFLKPLMSFFTNDPLVLKLSLEYGYIRILCIPLLFAMASFNTVLRSIGDAKSSMYILFLSSGLNLVLDPFFMFERVPGLNIPGLNLGVFGAALATVISIAVAYLIGLIILTTGKTKVRISIKGLFKLNREINRKLLKIGLPSGVSTFFTHFFQILMLKIIAFYGTAAVAAMGIGKAVFGFVSIPLLGMVLGGTAIVGQNLGVNQIIRIKKTILSSCFLGASLMTAIAIIAVIFPQVIMSWFTKDPEVIAIGINMLMITIPGFIFLSITSGMKPAFFGSGYIRPFLLSGIISQGVVQLPFLFCVIYFFNLGINFIWGSFVLAQLTEMLFFTIVFRKGDWKTMRI